MVYSKAALARLATEVRRELGLSNFVPFDPQEWAIEYGVPFVRLQDLDQAQEAVDHFTRGSAGKWSAALVRNGSGHLVVYNGAHSPARVRSDLAHEIAHIIAEHELNAGWLSDERCSGATKPEEKEASELAGALLVPVEVARTQAIRGGTPEALALKFGVSVEMAQWRMRVSGGHIIARRAGRRAANRT